MAEAREAGRVRLAWISCAALLLAAAVLPAALAHIVYGAPTLYQLLHDADLVARARIVGSPDGEGDTEAAPRRPLVSAQVLEVYRGEVEPGTLRFAQHGHGVAQYEVGDEALLFLRRIERSRELDELAVSGAARWVSLQEHDSAFTLTSETRPAFEEAVRGYLGALAATTAAGRLGSLRQVTFALLRSDEPRLSRSALRDLVLMGDMLVTGDIALELVSISNDSDLDIAVRLGVLTVLEEQELVDGPARWAELLQTTASPDLPAVARAAAAHPSPPVTAELVKLLAGADPEVAAAAAVSLGVPGNQAAVAPLARALESPEKRLRMAAIRGLGGVATVEALAVLQQAAEGHPDPAVRRRAVGEVARLEGH